MNISNRKAILQLTDALSILVKFSFLCVLFLDSVVGSTTVPKDTCFLGLGTWGCVRCQGKKESGLQMELSLLISWALR